MNQKPKSTSREQGLSSEVSCQTLQVAIGTLQMNRSIVFYDSTATALLFSLMLFSLTVLLF